MLKRLSLSALLLGAVYAAPLNTCDSQAACMDINIIQLDATDSNGVTQYDLCLFWDKSLSGCKKSDTISHACPATGQAGKIEGWPSNDPLCHVVSCGETATFGIKDGSGCKDSAALLDYTGTFNTFAKCSDGGSCGGNAKACQWTLKAPDCDETTTSTSPPTTTTTTTTTSKAPESSETGGSTDSSTTTTSMAPETSETGGSTDSSTTTTTTCTTTTTTTTKAPETSEKDCACGDWGYEECPWKADCVLIDQGSCACHNCDCDLINHNFDYRGVESIEAQCEGCFSCTYSGIGTDATCGEIGSANTYARVKDVLHTEEEMNATGDGKGWGYITIAIETLVIAGAVLVGLLLIGVCVCCVVKRRKNEGKGEIVLDDEVFEDTQVGNRF
eukprot:664717_1